MQSKQFFDKEEEIIQDDSIFKSIKGINIPKFYPRLSLLIFILLIFSILVMFLPWIQTSSGSGVITSINPEDRLQQIIAPTSGRIIKWYVRDGTFVKTGDNILEISDIDPYNISRLEAEIDAMQLRYDSAKSATSLMLKNLDRQRRLYNSGLSSKREMELANINYQKAVSEQEYYNTQLIKSRANLARQTNQLIKADRDGYIVNTLSSSTSKIVKPGDLLASFLPNTSKYAAEIYISGNDVPLVKPDQKVRLIFDGWPSIQFSGWPSVSIGTFPGRVKIVDSAASPNGLFRVMIIPDQNDIPWPNKNFLRMGTRCQGYIQLNKVKLGYELWRQLNGFPVSINNKENINLMFESNISGNKK